ncbi:MAG TPA: hypothetical protein VN577_11435 [Terriglobales bacterium]|nr:hypothetical protein [Terriglobales bacterium]
MTKPFMWTLIAVGSLLFASSMRAQDLSIYRGFRFGSDLPSVATQTQLNLSDAKTIHSRPALIQELEWHPGRTLGSSSVQPDSVKELLFSFYNGELFQIVVHYDRHQTEGLTDADVIEAISVTYGLAAKPAGKAITFSTSQVYNDSEKVIACWEDEQYSFNLYRSSYEPTFGMIAFSKKLDILARAAVATAIRLDEQEAPQRELARQNAEAKESRLAGEKARSLNKPAFRP